MTNQATPHIHTPRTVEELVVLDLDRTLLDSSAVTKLVITSLARHGVDEDRLDATFKYIEAQAGNSFYLFDFIKNEFPDIALDEVISAIMNEETLLTEDLLCDGADRLIYALEAQNIPHLVLTYGEQSYQAFKIALFQRLIGREEKSLPAIITSSQNKAQWVVSEWFNGTGEKGELPEEVMGAVLYMQSVVIIDDKSENLQSSDARVMGIHVDNTASSTRRGVVSTARVADLVTEGVQLSRIATLSQL